MKHTLLPPGYCLTAANYKATQNEDLADSRKRRSHAAKRAKARDEAIKKWYGLGGKYFLEWAIKDYRRHTGEKLSWDDPFLPEFYIFLGSPWLERTMNGKGAQMGYSEGIIALIAFCLAEIQIPCGMGFESRDKQNAMAPRVQNTFDYCEPIQRQRRQLKENTKRKDTDEKKSKMSVGGVEVSFFYSSTATKNGQERQASSVMSSFTAFVISADEVELWPITALDVATERQSACPMPSKPFRMGSTPGQEGGVVDAIVKASQYQFSWHVTCDHCGEGQFLHPFGNFLKPFIQQKDDGSEEECYVDLTGRPRDWFCHDHSSEEAKVDTSYVGCRHCGQELTWENICKGCFRCEVTGEKFRDIEQRLVEERKVIHRTASMQMPRLATILFKPAERIRKLLDSLNPVDQLQQGLGVAITVGGGKISLKRVQDCIGLPLPEHFRDRRPDFKTLGVDQGRSWNWGIEMEWFLADSPKQELRWLHAHCRITWWGHLIGFDGISEHCLDRDIDLCGCDNEPEVQLAGDFARKHQASERDEDVELEPILYPAEEDGTHRVRVFNVDEFARLESILGFMGWQIARQSDQIWVRPDGMRYRECFIRPQSLPSVPIQPLEIVDRELQTRLQGYILNSKSWVFSDMVKHKGQFQVFLFDQLHLKGETYRKSVREIQKEKIPMYSVHRTAGLDFVRDRIYRGQHHLPEGLTYTTGDHENLIQHYLSSDRTAEGLWVQAPGLPDHYFHAASFCELAALIHVVEGQSRLVY